MEEKKIRLNSATSQNSVNEDSFDKIQIESKSRLLPVGNIQKVINLGEQFNSERQKSPYYRLTGTINTLFNNVLFNITGENSWQSFNQPMFRDETFPPNASTIAQLDENEDITYAESVKKYLRENNGWFGYQDPDPTRATLCTWVDMEPRRELFSMAPKSGIKNWEITITYPVKVGNFPGNISHRLVNGGLLLVDVDPSIIGNRNMTTFATPVKHGLSQGDAVELKGLSTNNGVYTVTRVGKDNGDNKEYYFSVDISDVITLTSNPRMARIVGGRNSVYYLRVFKKIKVRDGDSIQNDDYEVYPLAFSQTIYEDKVPQFVINEDINVSGLLDNLGRPLSEIYITVIKTNNNGFTNIKSGIKMPLITNVESDLGVPDVNRIVNNLGSHQPLEDNINISKDEFYGDVVEYNVLELKENILGEVYHRFNTSNREAFGFNMTSTDFASGSINLGQRYEGYMYKPHYKIQIRNYSNYIEQGLANTLNKPTYAINLNDGRYIWRDLLDIGTNDTQENVLDYPFLNGVHYINTNFNLALKRQDPFNFYGLQHTTYPADAVGDLLDDKVIIKRSQDVC